MFLVVVGSDAVCEAVQARDDGVDLRPAYLDHAVDLDRHLGLARRGPVEENAVWDALVR